MKDLKDQSPWLSLTLWLEKRWVPCWKKIISSTLWCHQLHGWKIQQLNEGSISRKIPWKWLSIDWFEGKITGKSHIALKNLGFPVKIFPPTNLSIEIRNGCLKWFFHRKIHWFKGSRFQQAMDMMTGPRGPRVSLVEPSRLRRSCGKGTWTSP